MANPQIGASYNNCLLAIIINDDRRWFWVLKIFISSNSILCLGITENKKRVFANSCEFYFVVWGFVTMGGPRKCSGLVNCDSLQKNIDLWDPFVRDGFTSFSKPCKVTMMIWLQNF